MIAGDVSMEILPHAFNLVVVGAIRGQEMQFDLARQVSFQGSKDNIALMNAIVVTNQVQAARLRILATQTVQQVQKQITRFALSLNPDDHTGADIESASQVTLLVFAWREHLF